MENIKEITNIEAARGKLNFSGKTKNLVLTAMLLAIALLMSTTPLGTLSMGSLSIT